MVFKIFWKVHSFSKKRYFFKIVSVILNVRFLSFVFKNVSFFISLNVTSKSFLHHFLWTTPSFTKKSFVLKMPISTCIWIVFVLPADITAYPFLHRICKPPGQLNTVRTRNLCNRKTTIANSIQVLIFMYLLSFMILDFIPWENIIDSWCCVLNERQQLCSVNNKVLKQCRLPIPQFSGFNCTILIKIDFCEE